MTEAALLESSFFYVGGFLKKKICFLILLIIVLGILFERKLTENHGGIHYSDDYVTMREVQNELAFSAYENMDWDNLFEKENAHLKADDATVIMQKLGLTDAITVPASDTHAGISRSDWNTLYEQILDFTDSEHEIEHASCLVFDFIETEEGCILVTNAGEYRSNLPVSYYTKWQMYDLYVSADRCLGVMSQSEEEGSLPNAYLTGCKDQKLAFLFGGSSYTVPAEAVSEELATGVADLVFQNGKLTGIRRKQETIEGNLLSYDDTSIEIEGFGHLLHTGKLPVYQISEEGTVVEQSISDVVLGNQKITYVIGDTQVCAILITSPEQLRTIRVLLLNDSGGIYRQELYLKSDGEVTAQKGTETLVYPAGSVIDVGTVFSENEETLKLTQTTDTSQFYLCDAAGNLCSNGYEGTMEVRNYADGFTLVNVLSLEHYLYAVVPSEMPSSYEPEALKAQAVCARSYAYRQLKKAELASYGAHIDDSTSYQVYNKIPKNEASMQAVNATAGEVLTYEGDVIEAFYFSTSAGYTDTAIVWNVSDEITYPYLKRACLVPEMNDTDLSNEAAVEAFLSEKVPGYESEMPYYRWQATCDFSGKEKDLCQIFADRHSISPENVLYYETDGVTACEAKQDPGALQEVTVTDRSTSGSIITLRFTFQRETVDVKSEYNIRKVLALGVAALTCQDGTEKTGISLLPSAVCTVRKQADGSYLLTGGGFGHGLGMSQNGANGLAGEGASYREILKFFYCEIQIEPMNTQGGIED